MSFTLEGSELHRTTYAYESPIENLALIGLDLSLIALVDIARRRRNILTCTQDKTTKVKLERLRSARLIHRDQMATNFRHAKTSKVVQTQAY
jgi:hypothetical protein